MASIVQNHTITAVDETELELILARIDGLESLDPSPIDSWSVEGLVVTLDLKAQPFNLE